ASHRRNLSEGREVPAQHATGGRLLVYPQPLHDLPALFRFRLPARLRSMDLGRRHQLGNSRPLAGSARTHPNRRQQTVNGRRAARKDRPLPPSAWTAKSKELNPSGCIVGDSKLGADCGLGAIYGYIPANLEWDHYLEEYFTMQKFAQIGLYFFFSS